MGEEAREAMNDYQHIGDGLVGMVKVLTVLAAIGVVCGIWKAIDIAIWVFNHVSISWGG